MVFSFARALLEGRVGPGRESWDLLWARLPGFRRIWRVAGVIWGAATIADAALRFVMAYTMPVDQVPALNGAQWGALFVLLQVVTNIYYHRAGLYNPASALYDPLRQAEENSRFGEGLTRSWNAPDVAQPDLAAHDRRAASVSGHRRSARTDP